MFALVDTLEWRDGLALILVKGVGDDTSVREFDVRVGVFPLESEGVFHPALVVTL